MKIPLLSGLSSKNVWRRMRALGRILRISAEEFIADNGLKLSASLSYYTLFSMAPMLLIVISIGSILLGKEAAEGYLYLQFEGLMGKLGAIQLQEMINNVRISGDTPWVTAVGIITFFFGATGVFIEIQDSINTIWSIKAKPKRGWVRFLFTRLISFSMVVGIGFLLMVSLVLSALLSLMDHWINTHIVSFAWLAFIISNMITMGAVLLLFAVVFKVLPDADLKWRDVFVGAMFTGIMFLIGKSLINLYLSRSTTVSAYGAAGAVVLIILWVYYSAIILYFGAEFTKVYTNEFGGKIRPGKFAVFVETKEVVVTHQVLHSEEKRCKQVRVAVRQPESASP
ncbi:MAG: YihY/virulence factor BrkB family protein [Lewinellaceae bacterium]|nr:YihY/virulence factor BrkB family protein [Lewinellaceae bacterium]